MSIDDVARAASRAREIALASIVVVLVAAIDGFGCWFASKTPDNNDMWMVVPLVGATFIPAVVGWLIVRAQPRQVIGWLLLAQAAFSAWVLNADSYAEYAGVINPGVLPGAALVAAVNNASWPLLYVCLALIAFVFPDGHFLSARWRRFTFICLAGYAMFVVPDMFGHERFSGSLAVLHSPLPKLPGAVLWPLVITGLIAIPVSLVGAVVSARKRFKRATGDERVKMLWFASAALTIPGALALCYVDQLLTHGIGVLTFLGVTMFGMAVPIAIGIAILRHQLFDIELVLSRALTYGTLTVLVVGVYAALLAGVGALMDNRSAAGLIAVGIVAVAAQPVHARLRRRVERWVYGDRSDPYAALRRLSERLETNADPSQALHVVTASVAEALRVERVTLDLGGAGGDDDPDRHDVRVPLVHQGNRLGDLVVDVPRGRQLTPADRRMLDDLARHAAVIVDAVRLTVDLQASRARLVSAREEERRRLRRDLHDGVGPSLAAMVLKLNVLGATVDDPSSTELLGEVREETKAAIVEIRRLVDDLRPAALDEVGLLGTLRQKAVSLSAHGGDHPLVVEVCGPDELPPLPAAVEVAAYRIAMEAITNVVRHARASRCVVTVSVSRVLELTVTDNGAGARADARPGVGLASMRERADELGGSCTMTGRVDGGTIVHAVIPLTTQVPTQAEPAQVMT